MSPSSRHPACRGHSAISKNIFECHNSESRGCAILIERIEARNGAKHPTTHRMASHDESFSVPKCQYCRGRKPCCNYVVTSNNVKEAVLKNRKTESWRCHLNPESIPLSFNFLSLKKFEYFSLLIKLVSMEHNA